MVCDSSVSVCREAASFNKGVQCQFRRNRVDGSAVQVKSRLSLTLLTVSLRDVLHGVDIMEPVVLTAVFQVVGLYSIF